MIENCCPSKIENSVGLIYKKQQQSAKIETIWKGKKRIKVFAFSTHGLNNIIGWKVERRHWFLAMSSWNWVGVSRRRFIFYVHQHGILPMSDHQKLWTQCKGFFFFYILFRICKRVRRSLADINICLDITDITGVKTEKPQLF